MSDLLVPLYDLPRFEEFKEGFRVGKPPLHYAPRILSFIGDNFSDGWKAEAKPAFGSVPPTIITALEIITGRIVGFCCWDCTAKGFLGPIGVHADFRGKSIGRALVISALHSMREAGYSYGVIGDAGPVEFFRKICDARIIDGSEKRIKPFK